MPQVELRDWAKNRTPTQLNLSFKKQQIIFNISISHAILGNSSLRLHSPRLTQCLPLADVPSQPQREHTYTLYRGSPHGSQNAFLYTSRRAVSFTPEEQGEIFPPSLAATAWTRPYPRVRLLFLWSSDSSSIKKEVKMFPCTSCYADNVTCIKLNNGAYFLTFSLFRAVAPSLST